MVSKTTRLLRAVVRASEPSRSSRSTVANAVPLMPILHELQDVFGYIDPGRDRACSLRRSISPRPRSTASSPSTRTSAPSPPGASRGAVCAGARPASRWAPNGSPGTPVSTWASTSAARPPTVRVSLEQVFCLGNCALSPAVMIDGRLKGRVDEARFDELVAAVKGTAQLMAPVVVFVPLDAAARSVGADEVADAIDRGGRQPGTRGPGRAERLTRACSGSSRSWRSRPRRPGRLRPGRCSRRRRAPRRRDARRRSEPALSWARPRRSRT